MNGFWSGSGVVCNLALKQETRSTALERPSLWLLQKRNPFGLAPELLFVRNGTSCRSRV